MTYDFEKEYLKDLHRILKRLPALIEKSKGFSQKEEDFSLVLAQEILKISYSSHIRILKKYEHSQLERFEDLEKQINELK
ncbi:hypothetical protein [Paenibacillus montanisoli]|uniref:Uncharacterized protein n=1 Tax=Paenibacillus montanisoli TaxID=2081970 RepID=A0A328TSI5_9BACL|nr:hypothetical protein [Paenibacillus montanisoli]RAP73537.1 hypothetical protein DL346_24975 [Paenibacillus montanisoli]